MLTDFAALSAKLWPMPVNKTIEYHRKRRATKKLSVGEKVDGADSVDLPCVRTHKKKLSRKERAEKQRELFWSQAQWKWYNKRKSIVQEITVPDQPRCLLSPKALADVYDSIFAVPNDKCRSPECYTSVSEEDQSEIDADHGDIFSANDSARAIKSIGVDKSPGPDKVSMRVIRKIDGSGHIHAFWAMAVQRFAYYPAVLRRAHTVLIYKGGDVGSVSSWRPISIFDMSRRIISKMFERKLRKHITFSKPQLGFTSKPGCLLNITKLSSILKHAKHTDAECHAVLLDVRKAFDMIGHAHLSRVLASRQIPTVLRNVALAAIDNNTTCIQSQLGLLRDVRFTSGVAQGEPLSPLLFNLAIDFIMEELNSSNLRSECGYDDGECTESVLAFADDTTVIGRYIPAVQKLLTTAVDLFAHIGLSINASKTKWLSPSNLQANFELSVAGQRIRTTQTHELVRYLGAHFTPQQTFDGAGAIREFHRRFECVLQSLLLMPNQKLQLLQQYLLPLPNYTFQVTPSYEISDAWLKNLDLMVTNGLRELLQLPNGSCNAVYYAPRAMSGLAVTRFVWEARLQRLSALPVLLRSVCAVDKRRAVLEEATYCTNSIQVDTSVEPERSLNQPNLTGMLRQQLRERSFSEWTPMKSAGYGAEMYRNVSASNRWISKKSPLALNEWLMAIQLRVNACAVYAHPRMQQQQDSACRKCQSARESIGHVLGSCTNNMDSVTKRHNNVVHLIADELRQLKYTVYEERRCIGRTRRSRAEADEEPSGDGDNASGEEFGYMNTSRRIDIVAANESGTKAFLLDSTICIKHDEAAVQVSLKKKLGTYEPTIKHFQKELAIHDIEVHGLWFGSRGAHHETTVSLFKKLGLMMRGNNSTILDNISKKILKHSTMIMRNHLYVTSSANSYE